MAIDDPIEAALLQIEFDRRSPAPQAILNFLEALSSIGVKSTKPAAFLMKKVIERRADNTRYLLDAVILHVRRLEEQFTILSQQHTDFVENEFPRLMVEAVSKAQETGSKERIDRLGLVVVASILKGPSSSIDLADEMIRVSVELSAQDVDVLATMYSVQAQGLIHLDFLPEQNLANSTWKQLQSSHSLFKSSAIHSICAKLQSLGLVAQVERIVTTLDLSSIPYSVLRNGAEYLQLIGKAITG